MALFTQFENELDKLFEERTHWLRKAVGISKLGQPPKLNRKNLLIKINKLEQLSKDILLRDIAPTILPDLYKEKRQWHVKRGKGWGRDEKRKNFDTWFQEQIAFPNCIYLFWNRNRCKYVGRTINGRGRPQSYFDKIWFQPVTRIDIYSTSKASGIPALECLAIDYFKPTENKNKAAKKKWTRKCTICTRTKQISKELKKLFKLK